MMSQKTLFTLESMVLIETIGTSEWQIRGVVHDLTNILSTTGRDRPTLIIYYTTVKIHLQTIGKYSFIIVILLYRPKFSHSLIVSKILPKLVLMALEYHKPPSEHV